MSVIYAVLKGNDMKGAPLILMHFHKSQEISQYGMWWCWFRYIHLQFAGLVMGISSMEYIILQ